MEEVQEIYKIIEYLDERIRVNGLLYSMDL